MNQQLGDVKEAAGPAWDVNNDRRNSIHIQAMYL